MTHKHESHPPRSGPSYQAYQILHFVFAMPSLGLQVLQFDDQLGKVSLSF
jgi:hypothetical protein